MKSLQSSRVQDGGESKSDKKWEKYDGEVQLKVINILSVVDTDVGIVPLTSEQRHDAPHGTTQIARMCGEERP